MSIVCRNINLKHKKEVVIKDFSLELPEGMIVAFYGPTGSGKTALLLMLAGLMKPDSGEIVLDGINVTQKPRRARQVAGLGVIPGYSPLLSNLTLEENLLLQARILRIGKPRERVRDVTDWLELGAFAQTMTDDLSAFIRAKASLALALLNDPRTILLDEPEYRLTSEETAKIWVYLHKLKKQGKTIIVSTRYQEVAANCDQIILIAQGKVVDRHETESIRLIGTQTSFA